MRQTPCPPDSITEIDAVLPSLWNKTFAVPGICALPPLNTLLAILLALSPGAITARKKMHVLTNSAARRIVPRDSSLRSIRSNPKNRSIPAPVQIAPFNPSPGIKKCTVANTPIIAPSVLNAYTSPMLRSPCPLRSSADVINGSVIPAQNVAGNITPKAIPWL